MKVGFLAEPYEESHASGMGYMIMEMLKHIPKTGVSHEFTIYSSKEINKNLIGIPVRTVRVPASLVGKLFWFAFTKEKIDALLFVTPLFPLWVPKRIKTIVVCPELGSQKITPGDRKGRVVAFIRDKVLMPVCLTRASRIVTISKATKEDVKKFYGIEDSKIAVIYIAYQDLSRYISKAPIIPKEVIPYFFFSGRVKPRKNVHSIVSAFIQFKKEVMSDCKLVIAGSAGGAYKERMVAELTANGLENDVVFAGYVSTEMLRSYYMHSVALVFPSLNEGFGMPVLEAMSLGAPVITSNVSSLPEAAGDAALLVDPHNVDAIAGAMEKLFTDPELRKTLIAKGHQQAQKFSWEKTGHDYVALLETI